MIQDILQTVDVQEIVVIFHQYPKKELFFSNLKFSPTVKNSNTGGVTPKFKYFLFLYFCNSFRIRHRSLLRDFISCLPSNTSPHFGNKLFRFSEKTNFSSSVFFSCNISQIISFSISEKTSLSNFGGDGGGDNDNNSADAVG